MSVSYRAIHQHSRIISYIKRTLIESRTPRQGCPIHNPTKILCDISELVHIQASLFDTIHTANT